MTATAVPGTAARARETGFDLHALGADGPPWAGDVVRPIGAEHAELRGRLAGNDVLFLVEDRAAPVVVLPWSRWVELLRAAGMSPPLGPAA